MPSTCGHGVYDGRGPCGHCDPDGWVQRFGTEALAALQRVCALYGTDQHHLAVSGAIRVIDAARDAKPDLEPGSMSDFDRGHECNLVPATLAFESGVEVQVRRCTMCDAVVVPEKG